MKKKEKIAATLIVVGFGLLCNENPDAPWYLYAIGIGMLICGQQLAKQ